VNSRL